MAVRADTQGSRIRTARLAAGLTQAQLARSIGSGERNIVRWENDRNAPRTAFLARIADATGKPLEYFLVEEAGEPNPFPAEAA
jgi:transcriptional regulator with XRE-family HTH domain